MRPTIPRTIVAALVLVLCQEMADQAVAKVVRTGRSAPSNPAVEEGGLHLVPGPPAADSLQSDWSVGVG